jgi:hypothetical protein
VITPTAAVVRTCRFVRIATGPLPSGSGQGASQDPSERAHRAEGRTTELALCRLAPARDVFVCPQRSACYLPVASQRRHALCARVRPGVTAGAAPSPGQRAEATRHFKRHATSLAVAIEVVTSTIFVAELRREAPMWMIAGLLVGFVVLVSSIGFHLGSHAHVLAGALGVLTAAWLVFMLVDGQSAPVLWTLLTADVVVSVGVSVLAWKGLSTRGIVVEGRHLISPVAADGVALNDLSPSGIVRVNGENWSAVATNGTVRSGTPVQVLRIDGIRLEVWGEKTVPEDIRDVELEAEASRPAFGPRQDRSPWTLSEVEDEGQLQ